MVTQPNLFSHPDEFRVVMYQQYGVTDPAYPINNDTYIFTSLTDDVAKALEANTSIVSVTRNVNKAGVYNPAIFPHSPTFAWNEDNYGPITIPAKGKNITLTKENLPLYKRIISEYEHNKLETKGDDIYINGQKASSYTFQQDYYWMMGDNRHNSEDSRFWGFVPEDHVLGKPVLIWMSLDKNASGFKKIRWQRLFTTVNGEGEPVSYRYIVFGLLGLWLVYSLVKKKKVKE